LCTFRIKQTFYWQKKKSKSQNKVQKLQSITKTAPCASSITAASTDVARQAKAHFASSATALLLVAETLRRGEQSREAVGDKACKTENCTLECSFDKKKLHYQRCGFFGCARKQRLTISALAPLSRRIASTDKSPAGRVIDAVDPVEAGGAVAGSRNDAEASTTGTAVGLCEAGGLRTALKKVFF
jgi:hypothetical protein